MKNSNNSNEYADYLNTIFQKNLIDSFSGYLGRDMHLLIVGFGNEYLRNDRKMFEYELHIQTTWRIINIKKKEIVLTENDLVKTDNDYFCSKVAKINNSLPAQIGCVLIKANGDMDMFFGDNYILQVINCNSGTCFRDEAWRIVHRRGIKEHFVMSNEGMSLSCFE